MAQKWQKKHQQKERKKGKMKKGGLFVVSDALEGNSNILTTFPLANLDVMLAPLH